MNLITNYSVFIALTICIIMIGEMPVRAENDITPLLFDDWGKGEDGGGKMKEFTSWGSSNKKSTLYCLKAGQDFAPFVLMGKASVDGKSVVLGHGLDSVNVTWMQTSVGEIAIIDHRISSGYNELFALYPSRAGKWRLLYRTPEPLAPNDLAMDHCHWTVVSMDKEAGKLKLKAEWTFSNMSNSALRAAVTKGVYEVPLFYGTGPSVTGGRLVK